MQQGSPEDFAKRIIVAAMAADNAIRKHPDPTGEPSDLGLVDDTLEALFQAYRAASDRFSTFPPERTDT